MMEAVKRGGARQQIHEIIRTCSMKATDEMKNGGECNLLRFLSVEPEFGLTENEMKELLKPEKYIGRCSEQVERYLDEVKVFISDIDRKTAEITL